MKGRVANDVRWVTGVVLAIGYVASSTRESSPTCIRCGVWFGSLFDIIYEMSKDSNVVKQCIGLDPIHDPALPLWGPATVATTTTTVFYKLLQSDVTAATTRSEEWTRSTRM